MIIGLSGAAGFWWFEHYQPDRARYPLRGIDVSHHQGPIDWRAAAGDDVAFAYVKATEGGDGRDPQFAANWAGARRAGLAVGAYHYFTLCRPGRDQAANFMAAVPREADALPPAVDLEFRGNCAGRPSSLDFRRELDAFLAPVEARAGKRAILYMTPEFDAAYGARLPGRAIWWRSIVIRPDAKVAWTLWLYHNRGQVRGVAGPVDLDLFRGDRRAFEAFRSASAESAR